MMGLRLASPRPTARMTPRRLARPAPEHLESRLLLYSTLGDQWTYDSRITYSFMPDGTSVGGTPSVLFQTLNAVAPTATWESQIEQGASLWETAANVNLALVPDGGEPFGTNGNQQDDPRFGDIRIGAIPLPAGVLAETFLPPPANGGTAAGDIMFNSTATWGINNYSAYDLMTVAAHEFGHALGLGESSVVSAVMYGTYGGIKQSLTSDDISGIDSIYGAPQYDRFNSNGLRNGSILTAANITCDINGQAQITLGGLDLTVAGQSEWFVVTVPSSTTGQMAITVQSSNLSSLAPELMVYNPTLISQVDAPTTYGATISTTIAVQAGQKYYIKAVSPAPGTAGIVGAYGLLVNFGSQTQAPIPPPNTVVPDQPDGGGGTIGNAVAVGTNSIGSTGSSGGVPAPVWVTIGTVSGWVDTLNAPSSGPGAAVATAQPIPSQGGSMGALPSFSTTAAMSPQSDSNTSQQPSSVAGPLPVVEVVFQAADAILEDWHGHHQRSWTPRKHHR
jgi:hypothetical protein